MRTNTHFIKNNSKHLYYFAIKSFIKKKNKKYESFINFIKAFLTFINFEIKK